MKNWWQSKVVWANGVVTLIAVAQYFAVPDHTPVGTVASISVAVAAIAGIVFRVWFTDQPISQKAYAKMLSRVKGYPQV